MSALPSSHEIVELTEKYDPESQINKYIGKEPLKKYSIEDDINKLFEAIDIGRSRQGRDVFCRSAMKRPMRVVSGIGISDSVSLKQALRGLCISQASEMAAVKKQISRQSASPGVSEAGAMKRRLYKGVVIESSEASQPLDGGKRNLLEITLIPERSSSNFPDKATDKKLPVLDEIVPMKSAYSLNRGFGLSKQSLRTQTFVKKKIMAKTTPLVKNHSQHNEEAKSDHDIPVYVESNRSKTKSEALIKADERSRSKEKGEISQSSKSSSIGEYSSTTSYSEESYLSGSSRSGYRPHMSKDLRWEAVRCVQKQHGNLGSRHFKLLRKLGGGDIGTVYLSELIGTSCIFAMKVMNNDVLVSKKKMVRAQTEKEILEILDHPFLPTLYAHFMTNKFSCLVMEYCPGGDLHVLRQKQLTKCFSEPAARFYVAEVLLALEYLHMLGVVYRDLKPENILVREDGHIMLSDFDLSLRCAVNPMLLKSSSPIVEPPKKSDSSCIDPFCLQPAWQLSCFTPKFLSATSKTRKLKSELAAAQIIPLPQIVVEPTTARSNSFVGTHEYLAPEIIKGEGHGSAVDWWTFGILLYELLYGKTPFKGLSNEDTISNVVSQCHINFPECSMVSSNARDLITRLLKKEPENRLGSAKGAAEIKQHPFFQGLNWALIRCETPPELPKYYDLGKFQVEFDCGGDGIEFEMF
ncbi:hypothetical protein ACJIZ3_012204 [Penstemon smallii]|uniref:non-specific serine/threonine protein kinase n=1 Tax=Penstemon smallii TaxID=265156 RepID=A0ABD3ULD2_9LAMI